MATMADYLGLAGPAQNLVTEGSRANLAYARATIVQADVDAQTFNIRFPQLSRIVGFWVTVLSSDNNLVGYDVAEGATGGIDLTIGSTVATANRLTLADGGTYDLDVGDILHVLVVGLPY